MRVGRSAARPPRRRSEGAATPLPRRCDQDPSSVLPIPAAYTTASRQTAALRKARRFHSQAESPEIVRIARRKRILASRPHCFPQTVFVHPPPVVSDDDDGTGAVPMEVDPDVTRPRGDAVVDKIGERRRQLVAKRAKAFARLAGSGGTSSWPATSGSSSTLAVSRLMRERVSFPIPSAARRRSRTPPRLARPARNAARLRDRATPARQANRCERSGTR